MLNEHLLQCKIEEGEFGILRLEQMGVPYEIFKNAAIKGFNMQKNKSKYSLPLCKGLAFFDNMLIKVRSQLCLLDKWTIDDGYNVNRTIAPNQEFAIVLSSGNDYVGSDLSPSNKNKKGNVSQTVIAISTSTQLKLFDTTPYSNKYNITEIPHWFLLYRIVGKTIHLELSLPRGVKEGYITNWIERIILPPIDTTKEKITTLDSLKTNKIEDISLRKKY